MNKVALFCRNVYHYVTIYHPIYCCIKECFLSLFRQWTSESSIDLLLVSHCCSLKLVYKLLQSAIIFFASEWLGMCTDRPRKHVLFSFYFLLYQENNLKNNKVGEISSSKDFSTKEKSSTNKFIKNLNPQRSVTIAKTNKLKKDIFTELKIYHLSCFYLRID